MSSVYNISAATVALQSLRSIQKNLTKTQYQMSTGKKINDARDNASSWSVATLLQADSEAVSSIYDGLQTTKSLIDTALTGANSVVTAITSMQTQITAASVVGADTAAIDSALTSLLSQVGTYVSNATYGGTNLLTDSTGTGHSVIGGYQRTSGSAVSISSVTYYGVDLNTTAGTGVNGVQFTGGAAGNAAATTIAVAASNVLTITATAVGAIYTINIDGHAASYTQQTGDNADNIANGLKTAFTSMGVTNATLTESGGAITITNNNAVGGASMTLTASSLNGASGGLSMLAGIDHNTSSTVVASALATAETAAASLSTVSDRLDAQSTYLSSVAADLSTAAGTITDADMEALAAKVQALQTQQQLATQALSIANAQSANILNLFSKLT